MIDLAFLIAKEFTDKEEPAFSSRSQTRKAYSSDLTDAQWQVLEPPIPSALHGKRLRITDMREVVNSLRYLHHTGCQWDMLPHDLLARSTVYEYFAQWRDGTDQLRI